jgi:hypothetical protein
VRDKGGLLKFAATEVETGVVGELFADFLRDSVSQIFAPRVLADFATTLGLFYLYPP